MIRSVYHYERKGRLCQTVSSNLVGGYDRETLTYTLYQPGKNKGACSYLVAALVTANGTLYLYFDDWGKLLTTTHKLNKNPTVTLASHTYDALGRNNKKTVNNGAYATTYSYNIRSWLEKIDGTKFMQQLYYNTGPGVFCYNGNISR